MSSAKILSVTIRSKTITTMTFPPPPPPCNMTFYIDTLCNDTIVYKVTVCNTINNTVLNDIFATLPLNNDTVYNDSNTANKLNYDGSGLFLLTIICSECYYISSVQTLACKTCGTFL